MSETVITWVCPYNCGYTRPYTDDRVKLNRRIDHPLYGWISIRDLVHKNITTHDCGEYLRAKERMRARVEASMAQRAANMAAVDEVLDELREKLSASST